MDPRVGSTRFRATLAHALVSVAFVCASLATDDPLPRLGPVGSTCNEPGRFTRACGPVELEVQGRAVFVTATGQTRPVRRLAVIHEPHNPDGPEVHARVQRSGSFKFSAYLPHSVITSCVGGVVRSSEEWVSRSFLLRAPGCEEVIIEVTNEWKPHDVVMKCPSQAQ